MSFTKVQGNGVTKSITASDSSANNQVKAFTWLMVTTTAGDVKLAFADGTTDTIAGVPVGAFIPVRPDSVRIFATGTTAAGFLVIE